MSSSIDSTKPAAGSASTSNVRDNFGFAKGEINELMRATEDSVTAAGTADALTANFTNVVVLSEGITVTLKAASANATDSPTLNVDATGAKTIVKDNGAALSAGDISGSRHYCIFRYDATNTVWVLMNPSGASAYPVGSIYMNAAVSTNPATLFGFGTWVVFGSGRVPIGIDSGNTNFDTVEETGGSADAVVVSHTHTGTTNGGGSHNHQVPVFSSGFFEGGGPGGDATTTPKNVTSDTAANHTHGFTTGSTGSSGTDKNLQPYIVVRMWKRTA